MDWYIDRYDVSEWENVIYVAAGENNVAALTEDGSVLLDGQLSLKYQNEAREWTNIDKIVLNDDYIVGLKSDGTVVATGSSKYGECDINDWNDITEIAMGSYHTVGLKSDGTVVAAGNNENGQCDVGEWTDIVSVAATDRSTFGLKSDGTLEVAGAATGVLQWTEIIAIDAHCGNVAGLKSDGTIVIIGTVSKLSGTININDDQSVDKGEEDTTGSEAEVSEENTVEVTADIIKAAAVDEESGVHRYATSITMTEDGITAAIRADGTVVYTGTALDDDSNVYAAMDEWTDIVALAAGDCFILGLKSDGTIVAVENSSYRFFEMSVVDEIDSWTDIVVIVAAGCHALGLKSDGTVVAAGSDEYGESEVGDWSGIVMLAAGDHLSLGLTAAGDVVAVGNNTYRQCEISSSEGKGYVSIAACTSGSYAIRPDGHIVAYGDPDINTADDPISVFASTSFALALQADGTLSHSNSATYHGVATDGWSDVVELTGCGIKLLGRQSDGTVIKSTSEAPEVLWTGEELGY